MTYTEASVRHDADLLITDIARATGTDPSTYAVHDPSVWADGRWTIVHRAARTNRYPLTVASFGPRHAEASDYPEVIRAIQAARDALSFVTETITA